MLSYNPNEPQAPQTRDWTCAACSLAWLNRALWIDHAIDEFSAVEYIGEPQNINADYGLMDGSGARLAECLREQGAPAFTGWLDYWTTVQLATSMPLLIGGATWYHWVGVRGFDGMDLVLANSAPGWMGVEQVLSEAQWNKLGPFAVVAVPLLTQFPQIGSEAPAQ